MAREPARSACARRSSPPAFPSIVRPRPRQAGWGLTQGEVAAAREGANPALREGTSGDAGDGHWAQILLSLTARLPSVQGRWAFLCQEVPTPLHPCALPLPDLLDAGSLGQRPGTTPDTPRRPVDFFGNLELQTLLCQATPYPLSYPSLVLKFLLSMPGKQLGLEINLFPCRLSNAKPTSEPFCFQKEKL